MNYIIRNPSPASKSSAPKEAPVQQPAVAELPATAQDLINVNNEICDLLAEESGLMERLEVHKMADLQAKKQRLTTLMERQMLYMSNHPEVLAAISEQERKDLQKAGERFRGAIRNNYDRIVAARTVNNTIVKCITQEMTKKNYNPVYNRLGNVKAASAYRSPVSISVNQTV